MPTGRSHPRSGSASAALWRAQILIVVCAAAVVSSVPIGIVLLAVEPTVVDLVAGILLLVFSSAAIVGAVVGWLYLRRGAAVAASQQEFLAAVSHELRTPMTSMRMFVDALLDDRLTDVAQRATCLRTLSGELQRLDQLLGRLIELSKLEAMPSGFARNPVPVSEVVESALRAHRMLALRDPDADASVEVDVPDDLVASGDHDALVQALVNLLSNAWKYGEGLIRIEARAHGEHEIEIVVLDHGAGMAPSERTRVFEKFTRGSAAIDSGVPGSGLGLSIVDRIVRGHRGRVELRATVPARGGDADRGCAVHLYLPRARVEPVAT